MLLLYILWGDWPILMILAPNKQLQQELECNLQKPDYHSWWISKMQSGCEDTLEERHAIKFCFKPGKNATETCGIHQTAFRPSWIEFLRGIKDSRRAGSLWRMMCDVWGSEKVRTPELTGQIKNFMYKDRRVSIETISAQFDVSVRIVHTIIREELKIRKIWTKFVPRVLREYQNERRC